VLPKKSPFNFLLRNEENQPLKEAVINVIILLPCGTKAKILYQQGYNKEDTITTYNNTGQVIH
jgi:hypothetical protein